MNQNQFQIHYLPIFEQSTRNSGISFYIANVLNNPEAADQLVNDVEAAILERSKFLLPFEPYHSKKKKRNSNYRIYVRNYTIYYVVGLMT